MTVAIGNTHIVEEYYIPEARVVASNAIGQPYCFLGAAEIETKVSHAIVNPFPHNVAVISWGLAHSGKYGEVGNRRRVVACRKGNKRVAIKGYVALLKEDDLFMEYS